MEDSQRAELYNDLRKKVSILKKKTTPCTKSEILHMLDSANVALKALKEETRPEMFEQVGEDIADIAELLKKSQGKEQQGESK